MPTFCRHGRFIERCPICRETVPGLAEPAKSGRGARGRRSEVGGGSSSGRTGAAGASQRSLAGRQSRSGRAGGHAAAAVNVRREERSVDDGYRCNLVPGLRSSRDADRLAREIGFASGRLVGLESSPPGVYGEIRGCADIEEATWMCFLVAYLSPLEGEDPFAGIEQAARCTWASGEAPDLQDVPLGPRTSHDPARGAQTIVAYRRFAEHAGSQRRAFAGELEWSAQRRFERAFERLSLPGLGRGGRFDLLVTLGRLGLYELRADSLHVSAAAGARGSGMAARSTGTAASGAGMAGGHAAGEDWTVAAAKRVFGIGDALNIERRAAVLAAAAEVPLEALEHALWNWGSQEDERATMGFPGATLDAGALGRASAALGL